MLWTQGLYTTGAGTLKVTANNSKLRAQREHGYRVQVKQGVHEGDTCMPQGMHKATEWTIDKYNKAKVQHTCGDSMSGAQLN